MFVSRIIFFFLCAPILHVPRPLHVLLYTGFTFTIVATELKVASVRSYECTPPLPHCYCSPSTPPALWAAVPPPQKSSRFSPFKVPCSEVPQRAAPADPDSSVRCSSSRATMHVAYYLPVCSRPAGPLEHVWLRIALASSLLLPITILAMYSSRSSFAYRAMGAYQHTRPVNAWSLASCPCNKKRAVSRKGRRVVVVVLLLVVASCLCMYQSTGR